MWQQKEEKLGYHSDVAKEGTNKFCMGGVGGLPALVPPFLMERWTFIKQESQEQSFDLCASGSSTYFSKNVIPSILAHGNQASFFEK